MFKRARTLMAALGEATVVAGAALTVPLAAPASAAAATVTMSCNPPTTGCTDQQVITVSAATNTTFASGTAVSILMCADPGGTVGNLPQDVSGCDGTTVQGDSVLTNSDGSFSYSNYEIFQLPSALLGEGPSQTPKCDATDYCVLGVFSNVNDFTQPKAFSAPFLVQGQSAQVPETKYAVLLPTSAAALVGGAGVLVFWRRRRKAQAAA